MRELGERGDIIKRMHRGLTERGIERGLGELCARCARAWMTPIIGRLVDRGLDDELKGTAYAVVDGVDGRTHHIKLPDLDAAGDGAPGSIVELRKFDDAQGRAPRSCSRSAPTSPSTSRSTAPGATWLDRQNIAREPIALSEGGFGAEVRDAMDRARRPSGRAGLRRTAGQRVIFAAT